MIRLPRCICAGRTRRRDVSRRSRATSVRVCWSDRFEDDFAQFQLVSSVAAYAEVLRDSRWVRGLDVGRHRSTRWSLCRGDTSTTRPQTSSTTWLPGQQAGGVGNGWASPETEGPRFRGASPLLPRIPGRLSETRLSMTQRSRHGPVEDIRGCGGRVFWKPLILRTNCNAAASISSGVAGTAPSRRRLIDLHIR